MRLSLIQNEQYSELSDKLKGHNGILTDPIELKDGFFQQVYNNMNHYNKNGDKYILIEGLICTIIFNPFGPTINIIGLVSNELKKVELIYYRSLNPFSSTSYIVASCDHDYQMDLHEFFKNLFSGDGYNDFQTINTMPTFILPLREDLMEYINPIIMQMYMSFQADISEFNDRLKKTLGNPWDLATLELENAALKRSKKIKENEFDFNVDDINNYINLIFDQKNIDSHIKSIPLAWEGAINNAPAAIGELDLKTLLKELIYSGCTIFAGKLD
jgi:hypothetical protein